jgi:MFS family permease
MLGMVILVGMGERMTERFLPVYLLALGGGDLAIGLLSGLKNLLGALYSFPGGYLAARLGTKRALLVFNLLAMAGFLIVILVPSWPAVIAGSLFFLSWSAVSLPATMGLVARVLPKDRRTMGVSMQSMVRRFPMALGPVLGGLFIKLFGVAPGIRLGFTVAFFLAGLAIIVQQLFIEDDAPAPGIAEKNPLRVLKRMGPSLRRLLVSDILIRFCEQIPDAFVVVWCVETLAKMGAGGVSEFQFGLLSAIEMTTAVLCYIPVAYLADRTHKKPFVLATFVFFTMFPVVLYFCRDFWMLIFAFILRGLKEFGEPTRKALIMDLAPEDAKAPMFGAYYLVRDSIVALAALGGSYLYHFSPGVNFFSAFAFGLAGTIWFALRGQDLARSEGE